jgi:cyanophycinase
MTMRKSGATRTVLLVLGGLLLGTEMRASDPLPGKVKRGHLVLIGGGEKPPAAMKKFVELAGGPAAPIVVLPTASEDADVIPYYEKLFRTELGCSNVAVLDLKTRKDADRDDFTATLAGAKGIFFAGGDQGRITKALLDSPAGRAVEAAFAGGAVVGGTSAGTACQSALMLTGEGDFKVLRKGAVELARGLGLFPGVIVDQHFVARQRFNRLLTVVLEHPDQLGVGIDEDTALWVRPDGTFEVLGERSVLILDARGAKGTGPAAAGKPPLLGGSGVVLHLLRSGEAFDPKVR